MNAEYIMEKSNIRHQTDRGEITVAHGQQTYQIIYISKQWAKSNRDQTEVFPQDSKSCRLSNTTKLRF